MQPWQPVDCHAHTTFSDGRLSVDELIAVAKSRRVRPSVTDHISSYMESAVRTIDETGASRIFVQHRNGALVRSLRERGLDAHPIEALTAENFKRIPAQNLSLF